MEVVRQEIERKIRHLKERLVEVFRRHQEEVYRFRKRKSEAKEQPASLEQEIKNQWQKDLDWRHRWQR